MLLNSHSTFVRHANMPAWCKWALAATGNHISHHVADADHIRHSKRSIWVTHDQIPPALEWGQPIHGLKALRTLHLHRAA